MSTGIEDCIAMSEDGDWYAYPKTMTRGRAMSAVARSADDLGYGSWWDTLHAFYVRAGHIRPEAYEHSPDGWWSECPADDPQAVPCWIVRRHSGPGGLDAPKNPHA